MPRRIVPIFLLCAMVMGSCAKLPRAHAAETPFPDMERSWFGYRESVSYLVKKGAIGGYPDGTFKPTATVNRAELLKMIFTARGGPPPTGNVQCFWDIKEDAWYTPYVCAAKRRRIVTGYHSGAFHPEEPVNMAEAIKIIVLSYGKEIDEAKGEKWYEPYAQELDRTKVFPRWSYLPWAPLTRERAADLIARMIRADEDRAIANLSSGCGKSEGRAPSTVMVGGQERSFLLTVPDDYVAHDPAPLIVAFHGRTNPNDRVRGYYGLDRAADGYFIAYPAAIPNGNGSFSWAGQGDGNRWVRDVAFFDAIVEELGTRYCIDMDRIYTAGHSLGAWMANSVACIRGGIVRASATVGGDMVGFPCAGPSAAFIAHNPKDNLAPFSSTERAYERRVKENGCAPAKESSEPTTLSCQKHVTCDGGNSVVWCPHTIDTDERGQFYPHTWPRGTGEAIVRFFEGLKS